MVQSLDRWDSAFIAESPLNIVFYMLHRKVGAMCCLAI